MMDNRFLQENGTYIKKEPSNNDSFENLVPETICSVPQNGLPVLNEALGSFQQPFLPNQLKQEFLPGVPLNYPQWNLVNEAFQSQIASSTSNYFTNDFQQPQLPGCSSSIRPLKATKELKNSLKKEKISPTKKRNSSSPRKKIDRFDGVPEELVVQKFLPDHLAHNLDILIIGINPGLFAAHKGHHYAGPGNHFWKCLFLSGLTPEQFTAYDDFKMLSQGIGFTNIVARTSRGSADLSRKEIAEGGEILLTKIKYYQPKIAVFNGKGIYEIFSKSKKFFFGKQPEKIEGTDTVIWVMPSSSARCAQLPRAVDKVPFYAALKKLRDHLNGSLPELSEEEIVFRDLKLTNPKKSDPKPEPLSTS